MSYGFPALLAYAFVASFLLGLLKTGRWKILVVGVLAVWGVRLGPAEIDLLAAGTGQAYAWFALLSAGVMFPAFVVLLLGADLGMRLHQLLFARETETEPAAQAPDA
ncbi:MAG: hypothetical protein ACM3WS_06935, partial [Bacillota bacterium]